jgi:uncharacterized protein YdhG (YjbR/CyaY superfamily)
MATRKPTATSLAPRDIDDYLDGVPEAARAALEQLRNTIRAAAPKAEEVISYQIPTFKLDGRLLVSFAAFKNHCSFFPGAAVTKAHQDELKDYVTSKGTIRFQSGKPLPAALVKKLVKKRIEENNAILARRSDAGAAKTKRAAVR